MKPPASCENLSETSRLRIEVIDTDLDVAATFVQIAEQDVDVAPAHARELISKARTAYDATGKFLSDVEDRESHRRRATRHEELGESIRSLERNLGE